MSNYPDGMGRSWMLDSEDIVLELPCPKCGHEAKHDLSVFDGHVSGDAECYECDHNWEVDTYIEPDYDY